MAAPNTVYKDYKTRRRKAGTPDVDIDLYIAKFLQNTTPQTGDNWGDGYFNSTDTEAQKIAKIKDIFKIDGWLQVAKGTATTPEMGFIGFCHSRTAGNGLYHNWDNNTSPFVARGSGVRVPTTAQASAELLNDGGLNVKGVPDLRTIISIDAPSVDSVVANYPPRIDNTVAWVGFRSSFYNSSTKRTLQMVQEGTSTWIDSVDFGTLAPKVLDLITTGEITTINKSGLHTFRVLIENEEGTKYTDPLEVTIRLAVASFKYSASTASEAFNSGTTVTRYYDTRVIIEDTQIFSDESGTQTANGYYVLGDKWYQYGYNTVTARYCVLAFGYAQAGGYPAGDPGNIVINPEEAYYQGYDQYSQNDADTHVLSNNYNAGYLYLKRTTDYEATPPTETYIAYSNAAYTTFAQDGYYSFGNYETGITRRIQVGASGVIISDETV